MISMCEILLWPNTEKIRTFKLGGIPSEEVKHHPLPIAHLQYIGPGQSTLVLLVILGEDVLKVLRHVAAFHIERHCVRAVLDLVYSFHVKPEEAVWEDARSGGVGHDDVDDGGDEKGKGNRPAPAAEAIVGILGPDDAVVVLVKVLHVLLGNLRVCMLVSTPFRDIVGDDVRSCAVVSSPILWIHEETLLMGRS